MKYAVNLADLCYPDRVMVARCLIGPVKGQTVQIDKDRMDGVAVLLDCDEKRGRAIVDVLRIKYKRNALRCYESESGRNWRRI